jgi:hypothetical protein
MRIHRRVGYQCRKFYHRLLPSGELKAQPGELEAIKRSRGSKNSRKVTSVVGYEIVEDESQIVLTDGNENSEEEIEMPAPGVEESQPNKVEKKSPDIESRVLFSTHLQYEKVEQPVEVQIPKRMKKPWESRSVERIVKFPAASFECEASAILKANCDNPLNMLLFSPPGGESATNEYINAIKSHLISDTQAQKDGLLAAYFRITQAPEEHQKVLAHSFREAVLRTAH